MGSNLHVPVSHGIWGNSDRWSSSMHAMGYRSLNARFCDCNGRLGTLTNRMDIDCSVLAWAKSQPLDSGLELLTSITFVNRVFYVKCNFIIDIQSSDPEGCVRREVWLEPPHFVSHKNSISFLEKGGHARWPGVGCRRLFYCSRLDLFSRHRRSARTTSWGSGRQ